MTTLEAKGKYHSDEGGDASPRLGVQVAPASFGLEAFITERRRGMYLDATTTPKPAGALADSEVSWGALGDSTRESPARFGLPADRPLESTQARGAARWTIAGGRQQPIASEASPAPRPGAATGITRTRTRRWKYEVLAGYRWSELSAAGLQFLQPAAGGEGWFGALQVLAEWEQGRRRPDGPPLPPDRALRFEATLDASPSAGATASFARGQLTALWEERLGRGRWGDSLLRLTVAGGAASDGTPLAWWFRLGGEERMRGFELGELTGRAFGLAGLEAGPSLGAFLPTPPPSNPPVPPPPLDVRKILILAGVEYARTAYAPPDPPVVPGAQRRMVVRAVRRLRRRPARPARRFPPGPRVRLRPPLVPSLRAVFRHRSRPHSPAFNPNPKREIIMIDTTIDGRRLQFNFDGTLLSPKDGAIGTWTTADITGAPASRLFFKLPDQTPSQLNIDYGLNADNQLTMAVPVQPGVTTPVAPVDVPGRIFADDPNDIQYATLAADGTVSPFRIFVYGALRLEQRTDQLILKLRDSGRDLVIQGDRINANCLTSDAFQQPGQDTIDRLRFTAKTRNKVGAVAKLYPADIQFTGRWNFVDGKLAFAARYSTTGGQPSTIVALVGTYKATNFGLVFSSTAAGRQFTFRVDSRFQVSGVTGEWELQLGYSSQSRFASGSFTAKANLPVGKNGELAIQGTVKFASTGGSLSLEVDLQASYKFANGQLLFLVKSGPGGYSLYFGGQFKVGPNGTVTFALNYGPGGPSGRIAIELGQLGDRDVKAGLELILSRSGSQLTIDIGVAFSVTWVNGTMIAA